MTEVDIPEAARKSNFARAVEDDEGIEHLEKGEAVFYLAFKLEGEVPEGHPSDHNGNVKKDRIKRWAKILSESDDFETPDVDVDGSEGDD